MKKILPWLLLLLLLIIFCVWTKKDSIHLSSKTTGQASSTMMPTQKRAIDYAISQQGETYHLRGNFKDMAQQKEFTQRFIDADKTLIIKETSTNHTLVSDDGLELTHKVLPYFIEHYKEGKLRYDDKTLHISGMVNSQDEINTMQSMLAGVKDVTVNNGTRLDPKATQRAEAEKAAALAAKLAKEKAEAEAKALALAEKNAQLAKAEAQRLATEKADIEKANQEAGAKAEDDAQKLAKEKESAAQRESDKLAQDEANMRRKARLASQEAKLAEDKAREDAAKDKVEKNAKIIAAFKVKSITFNSGKSTLSPEGDKAVTHLAKLLKNQYANINIEIGGHTDSDGSEAFNQKLSQTRVDAVKAKLMSQGITEGRLSAIGYGEAQPLVPNDSSANKQKNRRVQIKILGE